MAVAALVLAVAGEAEAQQLRGRVLDSSNGQPVQLAAVWLLDRDRESVALAMADSVGRYFLTVPDSGEYFIAAERFGYFETESPLLSIAGTRDYDLDLELRPEPIRVEGVDVTVQNERVIDWLKLEYGVNPVQFFGFRVLQGERLQEAKMKGKFNPTETLRWLYIPVSHGRCVTINGIQVPESESLMRGLRNRAFQPGDVPAGTLPRGALSEPNGPDECGGGGLYVNDRAMPPELIDDVDMTSIALVVTLPNTVRMYTYDFNWAFRQD
jgi:hypothetical protein